MSLRPERARQPLSSWLARPLATAAVAALALVILPGVAHAQDESIAEVVSFLLTNRSVVTDDFERDEAAAAATRDAIARALQIELATLPIGSSSGGFAYRFNPSLGTSERTSDSFGPFFVERSLTIGQGGKSIGVSYQYARYDRLDGRRLRDGSLVTTANVFTDESQPFDREALTLRLQTSTFTVFGSVGVTDRVDLSVAAPIVSLDVAGERVDVFRGQSTLQARATASVVGLADMALRAKYHLIGERGSGLAAELEVRLPTGDEDDLLGAGKAAYKGVLIGSAEGTKVTAHFNVAYSKGGISDQVDYAGACTLAVAARFTLVGEAFGRSIDVLGRLQSVTLPHPTIQGVNTIRLVADDRATRTGYLVGGFKWNIGSTWILAGNVLVPAVDRGLRAAVVPTIALDYAFGR